MATLRILLLASGIFLLAGLSKCPRHSPATTARTAPLPQPGLDEAEYQLACPGGTALNGAAGNVNVVKSIALNAFCTSLPGTLPPATGPGSQDPRYHVATGAFVGPLKITPNCLGRVLTIESPEAVSVVASFAADGTFIIPNITVQVPLADDKLNSPGSCLATLLANLRGTVTCPAVPMGSAPTIYQNAVIALTVDWGYLSTSVMAPIPSQPAPANGGQRLCSITSTCTTSQFVSLSCGR